MASRFCPAFLFDAAGKLPLLVIASLSLAGAAAAQPAPPTAPAAPASVPAKAEASKARVKVSDQMLVDLHVKDENITSVLELLSIQSQKNIIASKSVTGKISADLYNVTFNEALDAILNVNGYTYQEKGNFIYVYTMEEFDKIQKASKQRTAKVIKLNYLNATDAAEFVKPMLSLNGGEIKTTTKTEEFKISDNAPTGKDDFALGATIVIIDYDENIRAVEKLLSELDTKPSQVLVEATVMQTKLDEANAFGIDFSVIGDVNFTDFATVGGPRAVADALGLGTGAGAGGGVSPANNNGFAVQSTPGRTAGRSTLKVGVISKNLAVVLRLLDEVSDTTVMANPKLLVLNRQPARVQVIDRLAYISTTQTETSQTQTVQFLDTGVQLYFRPFVSATGDIRMELKPQVSTGTTKDIKGTGGAAVTVPDESRQEITTNVIVQDGMTIVLGGLFRETTVATRSQVPLFGDIPILGTPFRGHDDNTRREEIIFLVTPTIVNDKVLLSQSERAVDVIDRVRAGTRQGLLVWSRDKRTASLNVEAEAAARAGDSEHALWKIQQSLQLNPRQPDALRLRERLIGEKEIWPSRRMLDDVIREDTAASLRTIPAMQNPPKHLPWREGQLEIPRQPVGGPTGDARPAVQPGHNPAVEGGPMGSAAPGQNATDPANQFPTPSVAGLTPTAAAPIAPAGGATPAPAAPFNGDFVTPVTIAPTYGQADFVFPVLPQPLKSFVRGTPAPTPAANQAKAPVSLAPVAAAESTNPTAVPNTAITNAETSK
ncbi:hypothetical protein BH11PLA1_BH11PLA1_06430 [soil metagenome]